MSSRAASIGTLAAVALLGCGGRALEGDVVLTDAGTPIEDSARDGDPTTVPDAIHDVAADEDTDSVDAATEDGPNCPVPLQPCGETCTDLSTDTDHCGSCNAKCAAAHTTFVCVLGHCQISACDVMHWADCDGDPSNGCETQLYASESNCGVCGNQCSSLQICAGGACATECCGPLGAIDCTQTCDCIYVDQDPNNCGGCSNKCVVDNGKPGCVNGKCLVASCAAGFADCDGNFANGCEASTATDAKHCGDCGIVCPPGGVCLGGNCSPP